MKKTNLFLVGAPRCGTTKLFKSLVNHKQIYHSNIKEPSFFCTDIHKESDRFHKNKRFFKYRKKNDYEAIYNNFKNKKNFYLDASTIYLFSNNAAKEIFKYNPESKIIIIVRDLHKLILSIHKRLSLLGKEWIRDPNRAINLSAKRKNITQKQKNKIVYPSALNYLERIKLQKQIRRYYKIFPKEQILVIRYEDLFFNKKSKIINQINHFLNLEKSIYISEKVINKNYEIKNKKYHDLIHLIINNRVSKYLKKFNIYKKIINNLNKINQKSVKYVELNDKISKHIKKQQKILDNYLKDKIHA